MKVRTLAKNDRRGGALVLTAVSLTSLSVLSLSLLSVMMASSKEQRLQREKVKAEYVCEAALQRAAVALNAGGNGALGSVDAPQNWGESQFWVDAAAPSATVRTLTATARDDRVGARMELTLERGVDAIWRYGAFGEDSLTMDSNARVDSYDSNLGTWASQAINGSGSDQHASTDGDVGSNGSVTMEQNSKVWGDATCGPNSSTTVMGNAVCTGASAPSSAPFTMPTVTLPFPVGATNVTVNTTLTLASGNHAIADFAAKSNSVTTVIGPATIVVRNFQLRSGAQFLIDNTNGPVEIFVQDDFVLGAGTTMRTDDYRPADLEINLLSDNIINPNVVVELDSLDFNSNAKVFGTVLAPSAAIEINSNFELFGALIAKSVDLDSNCRIHYDEDLALSKGGTLGDYEVVCWRTLPYTH